MVPHHRSQVEAEAEAERLAELTGAMHLVWRALRLAGASACWTVTKGTTRFPACCAMTIARQVFPRSSS